MTKTNAPIGLIKYVNMLPYGMLSLPHIFFDSPKLLNHAIINNTVKAGCMSAVAGLRANLTPIIPFFGIGAAKKVQSVYLEPIFSTTKCTKNEHKFLWELVNTAVTSLEDLSKPLKKIGKIQILSPKASEQSEWLFTKMLNLKGFEIEIISIAPEAVFLPPHQIAKLYKTDDTNCLRALLAIGNPALFRSTQYPSQQLLLPRIDLAEFWQKHTNLPCIFALWFANESFFNEKPLHNEFTHNLITIINTWNSSNKAQKHHIIKKYLPEFCDNNSFALDYWEQYLSGIDFNLNDEYKKTLDLYKILLNTDTTPK